MMTLTKEFLGVFWCSFHKVLLGNGKLYVMPSWVHLPSQHQRYPLAWWTMLSEFFFCALLYFSVRTSLVNRQAVC